MSFDGIMQSSQSPTTDGTAQAGTPSAAPTDVTDAIKTPTAETEKKDPFADNFQRLVRREKMLRERESKLTDYEKRLAEYTERERLAKDDPSAFLDRHGLSLEEISKRLIEDPPSQEKKELLELKQKMAKWEQEKEQEHERRQKEETSNAYDNAKRELTELLDKDPEKFELVRMQNAHELVFQVIHEYQQQFQKWLTFEEAATKVESHLEKEVEKLLESKKLRSKLSPKTDSNQPEDSMGTQQTGMAHGVSSPTLSNFNANQSTPRPDGRVSDEELMKRAMAVMKNG